jgi:hypothetical protein
MPSIKRCAPPPFEPPGPDDGSKENTPLLTPAHSVDPFAGGSVPMSAEGLWLQPPRDRFTIGSGRRTNINRYRPADVPLDLRTEAALATRMRSPK